MGGCMSYSEPKELIQARKLIEEVHLEEALQFLKKKLSFYEINLKLNSNLLTLYK